jgi:catecholate siderophore receptor
MSLFRLALTAAVALLGIVSAAPAQTSTPAAAAAAAPFTGRVLDPDGRGIRGARVELGAPPDASAAAGPAIAITGDGGEFTVSLPPGRYVLSITATGFAPLTRTLTTPVADTDREFVLQIAAVHEQVDVTAAIATAPTVSTALKTATPLLDTPQSITVISSALIRDQLMSSVTDVVRYVPGITAHQGENNRDQVIIRGNNSSADFFLNGVRDDVQYYRDLYNLERVEALKGPNAMIFGRGGGGGVVNRVTKEAGFMPVRDVTLVGGSYDRKRLALDVNQPLSMRAAIRINTMYENSGSFRYDGDHERYGINPTVTFTPRARTRITLSYEHFKDDRVADRGISSFEGRPLQVSRSTFFGNPDESWVDARTNIGSLAFEHEGTRVTVRNRTHIGDYDRGYQNFVPGAVNATGTQVSISAYNNHTQRLNTFNQTDVTWKASTGRLRHLFLTGVEVGRQQTDNLRNTGYFNGTATSVLAPLSRPTIDTPVEFRQSATDANNHVSGSVAALYAQDQIDLSDRVQAIAGVRVDRFDLQYHNNRNGDELQRIDRLVSPRAGLVYKPRASVSIYSNYSTSFLPSSGDQFSSLTTVTQQVKPERFTNYEVGAKWSARRLTVTTALYRLDRTNTRATDPNDPTRIVQTGSQRTNGWELGVDGYVTRQWQIAGGLAYQDAFVTSATTAAKAGAHVAQVPRRTFSLWNMYQAHPRLGAGIGVVYRSDMFAAIDNTVTLPGYTNVDAAIYVGLNERNRLQLNVENVFDRNYYINADSNTNISFGSPRAAKIALVTRF